MHSLRHRLALAATVARRRRGAAPGRRRPRRRPDHGLRGRLAHRRLPADRRRRNDTRSPARTRSRRRSGRARPPTSSRRRTCRIPQRCTPQGLCSRSRSCSPATRSCSSCRGRNPAGIRSVYDLRKAGTKLVVAGAGRAGRQRTRARSSGTWTCTSVLSNVVSKETDVREVLAKVALGEADAGFVYSTDARTVPGKVTVIALPAWAQPKVRTGSPSSTRAAGPGRRAGVRRQGARARPARRSCAPPASCRAVEARPRPVKKYGRRRIDREQQR